MVEGRYLVTVRAFRDRRVCAGSACAVVLPDPDARQCAEAGAAAAKATKRRITTVATPPRRSQLRPTSSRRRRGVASGELELVDMGAVRKIELAGGQADCITIGPVSLYGFDRNSFVELPQVTRG